jgi:hypothetical protein
MDAFIELLAVSRCNDATVEKWQSQLPNWTADWPTWLNATDEQLRRQVALTAMALGGVLVAAVVLWASGRLVDWGISAMNAWRFVRMWASAMLAVDWGLCDSSTTPIPLSASRRYWRHGPDAFAVACSHPKGRRFAAWVYRWHAAPDPDDWEFWARRLGTLVPQHTLLLFRDGCSLGHGVVVRIGKIEPYGDMQRIAWGEGGKPTGRSVKFVTLLRTASCAGILDIYNRGTYDKPQAYVESEAPEQFGPIRLGGLAPEQLVADSKPPLAHGDVYKPPAQRSRKLS